MVACSAVAGTSLFHIVARAVDLSTFWKARRNTFTQFLPQMIEQAPAWDNFQGSVNTLEPNTDNLNNVLALVTKLLEFKNTMLPEFCMPTQVKLETKVRPVIDAIGSWTIDTPGCGCCSRGYRCEVGGIVDGTRTGVVLVRAGRHQV